MSKTVRRLISFVLVFMLIASISAPVFAATKPTATLKSYTSRIKRGRTAAYTFTIRSGSYTRYRNIWRSEFDVYVKRSSNNKLYGYKEVYFTGNINYRLTYTYSRSIPTGKYKVNYQTWYRPYLNRNTWYRNTNRTVYTTVVA